MRDKKRTLVILLCVCAVLGIGAVFLLRPADTYNGSEDSAAEHEHYDDEGFIENTDGSLLIDRESTDVSSVVLTNQSGRFTIKRDSVTASLYIEEIDRNIPICEDFLEYVWYYAYCLGYNYMIVSTADAPVFPADYGLDTPSADFRVTYSDGTASHFYFGDELASSEDVYYAAFDGYDSTVFITEMSLAAFQGEGYFIDTDFFDIAGDDEDVVIGKIEITGSAILQKIVIEPYSSDDRSDQSYGHSHIITAPVKAAVNDVNTTALVNELIYLAADSAVCSNPDKKQIAECGLDNPSLIFKFERSGKQQVLYIGNTDNSTYCYAMLKGLDVIYIIDPAQAEAILSSSLSFYRSGELRIYRVNAVESVTVSFGDERYVFDVIRNEMAGDSEYYEYHVYNGETKLSNDIYRDFLSVLSSAYAVSWDTAATSKESALTVTVKYFDNFNRKTDVLKFYPADFNRYVIDINGTKTACVSAIHLEKVMDASRKLAANEKINV